MNKRLLMISTDRKILEEGSDARARQIEHAKGWDEVHIVVFARRKYQIPNTKYQIDQKYRTSSSKAELSESVISANCWAYSTKSRFKFLYPFDAMRLGRFIMEKREITDITCQDASLTAMAGISLKKRSNGRASNKTPDEHSNAVNLEIQVHEDIGSPNYAFNWTNKIRKFLALNYLPKADRIRVVSNRIKEFLVERLGIEDSKIEMRPIAVDTEAIKNAPILNGADLHKKYPRFDKIVLMAGRLEPEKNVRLAIAAWKSVIEKQPKAGLIIVGSGSLKNRLERQAKKLCGSSIIFEDWADKAALYSYYKTADLFLNTSLFEGYGMALVEAHAAGCRVVSTDVGVIGDVLKNGDTLKDGEEGVSIADWDERSVALGVANSMLS